MIPGSVPNVLEDSSVGRLRLVVMVIRLFAKSLGSCNRRQAVSDEVVRGRGRSCHISLHRKGTLAHLTG